MKIKAIEDSKKFLFHRSVLPSRVFAHPRIVTPWNEVMCT